MIAFKLTNENIRSWGFWEVAPGSTKYVINRWIKPIKKQGPLTVFKNYSDLIKFREGEYGYSMGGVRSFICEIKKSRAKKIWCSLGGPTKISTKLPCLPNGTILCSSVKLLKEIT